MSPGRASSLLTTNKIWRLIAGVLYPELKHSDRKGGLQCNFLSFSMSIVHLFCNSWRSRSISPASRKNRSREKKKIQRDENLNEKSTFGLFDLHLQRQSGEMNEVHQELFSFASVYLCELQVWWCDNDNIHSWRCQDEAPLQDFAAMQICVFAKKGSLELCETRHKLVKKFCRLPPLTNLCTKLFASTSKKLRGIQNNWLWFSQNNVGQTRLNLHTPHPCHNGTGYCTEKKLKQSLHVVGSHTCKNLWISCRGIKCMPLVALCWSPSFWKSHKEKGALSNVQNSQAAARVTCLLWSLPSFRTAEKKLQVYLCQCFLWCSTGAHRRQYQVPPFFHLGASSHQKYLCVFLLQLLQKKKLQQSRSIVLRGNLNK